MNSPTPSSKRVALVTGASRGIGRGIAIALGQEGFAVAINYNANAQAAQETAEQVQQAGGQALTIQADVASMADHQKLIDQTLQTFGRIDLLVNNAGVAPSVRADLLDMGTESYDRLMNTNLRGPFFLTQQVAKWMVEHRSQYTADCPPAIVNVSSISAYTVSTNRGEYCISKAGLSMMTQLFATRLAEHNINVYEIRPGIIATDMTGKVKEKYDQLIGQGLLPLKRWGHPEDIAKAVIAIAKNLLPYSTGQVIDIDGGFHITRL